MMRSTAKLQTRAAKETCPTGTMVGKFFIPFSLSGSGEVSHTYMELEGTTTVERGSSGRTGSSAPVACLRVCGVCTRWMEPQQSPVLRE